MSNSSLSQNGSSADVETRDEVTKKSRRKTLGEDIRKLMLWRDKKNAYESKSYLTVHKMNVNFHMFGALMMNRIGREIDSRYIVTINQCGSLKWAFCTSTSNWRSQVVSATALATSRYSPPALDREMEALRLEDQETREEPKKTQ